MYLSWKCYNSQTTSDSPQCGACGAHSSFSLSLSLSLSLTHTQRAMKKIYESTQGVNVYELSGGCVTDTDHCGKR